MTVAEAWGGLRPFAVVLALAATTAFWVPTVAAPADSRAGAAPAVVVVAAPGAFAPALM
ncbi:MAG: hypothetical protein P8Y58_10080 [Novosphingobium sp.]